MPEASGFCYTGEYALPISFIMSGIYDDYGCVEDIVDNLASRTFMKWFTESIENESITVENSRYQGQYDVNHTILEIMNLLERDLVTYHTKIYSTEISVNIGINMWHKRITKDSKPTKGTGDVSKITDTDYLSLRTLEDCQKDIEEESIKVGLKDYRDKYKEDLGFNFKEQIETHLTDGYKPNYRELPPQPTSNRLEELGDELGLILDNRVSYDVWSKFDYSLFTSNDWVHSETFKKLYLVLQEITVPKDTEELKIMLKYLESVIWMKSSLRQAWQAHSGKGSQQDDSRPYLELISHMRSIIKDNTWDEDD